MRIVAGKYGSRSLKSPKNDATRPTQDKIKGAIFSSLGNMFDGGNFLDCYSGTGNMGLEAVSRGMDHATLVDNNKGAISVIKENVKSLKAEKETKIICGNIFSVLERLTLKYDVVYIDPPYAKQENEKLIQKLEDLDIVKSDGVIVVESLQEEVSIEVKSLATSLLRVSACMLPIISLYYSSYFTMRAGGKTLLTFFFDSGYTFMFTFMVALCLTRFTNLPIFNVYLLVQCVDIPKAVLGITLVKKGIWVHNIVNEL